MCVSNTPRCKHKIYASWRDNSKIHKDSTVFGKGSQDFKVLSRHFKVTRRFVVLSRLNSITIECVIIFGSYIVYYSIPHNLLLYTSHIIYSFHYIIYFRLYNLLSYVRTVLSARCHFSSARTPALICLAFHYIYTSEFNSFIYYVCIYLLLYVIYIYIISILLSYFIFILHLIYLPSHILPYPFKARARDHLFSHFKPSL